MNKFTQEESKVFEEVLKEFSKCNLDILDENYVLKKEFKRFEKDGEIIWPGPKQYIKV